MSESKWWKGQRVFGAGQGPGTIIESPETGLIVEFDTQQGNFFRFNLNGMRDVRNLFPTLFPIDTEGPKENVKQLFRYDCWVNAYIVSGDTVPTFGDSQVSREAAILKRGNILRYVGDPIHIVHEWEE